MDPCCSLPYKKNKEIIEKLKEFNFEILDSSIIIEGGFSKVYLVNNSNTYINSALKIIIKEENKKDKQKIQFENECFILKSLFHPFINNFINSYDLEEFYIINTHLVQGGELTNLMNNDKLINIFNYF